VLVSSIISSLSINKYYFISQPKNSRPVPHAGRLETYHLFQNFSFEKVSLLFYGKNDFSRFFQS